MKLLGLERKIDFFHSISVGFEKDNGSFGNIYKLLYFLLRELRTSIVCENTKLETDFV